MVISKILPDRLEIRHIAVKVSSGNIGFDKAVLFNNSHRRMALVKSLWSIRGNIWLTKMTISLADRRMPSCKGPLVLIVPRSSTSFPRWKDTPVHVSCVNRINTSLNYEPINTRSAELQSLVL